MFKIIMLAISLISFEDELNPKQFHSYFITKGTSSRVQVLGDGKSDIDCYVYDMKENLLSADKGASSICTLDIPKASVIVKVVNVGNSKTKYSISQ